MIENAKMAYANNRFQSYKKQGKFGTQVGNLEECSSIVGDFDTIPLIDVSGIYSENLADRKDVAMQIRDASTRIGFFYVTGHGIQQDVIDHVFDVGRKFFEMSFDDKMECFINNTPHYRGYTPLYGAGKPNAEGLGSK